MGLLRTVMLLLGHCRGRDRLPAWLLYATQRSQIYFPTPETEHLTPRCCGSESQGERIKVWVVARPGPRALLYFGGNAEDVAGQHRVVRRRVSRTLAVSRQLSRLRRQQWTAFRDRLCWPMRSRSSITSARHADIP